MRQKTKLIKPSVILDNIGNGKFEYVQDIYTRKMLVNAWKSISETNLWDFVIQDIHSFIYSDDPRINIISEKMEQNGYHEHSGASFGYTMRKMQYLAKHGEENFKKIFYVDDYDPIKETILRDETTPGLKNGYEESYDSNCDMDPYPDEDAMEYEQRLKHLLLGKTKREEKVMDYMNGY